MDPERAAMALAGFERALRPQEPLLDVVSFAAQDLGIPLYKRQQTLHRTIFLEVDSLTECDREVLEEWGGEFGKGAVSVGVPADTIDRMQQLRSEGRPHFREVHLVVGRRGSKNYTAAIAICYDLYLLLREGCPQEGLGLDPDTELVVQVVATNLQQGKDIQFRMLEGMLERSTSLSGRIVRPTTTNTIRLRTDRDEARRAALLARGLAAEDVGSIRITAIPASARAARGVAAVAVVLDEVAHLPASGAYDGQNLVHAMLHGLDQTKGHALVIFTTSPSAKTGVAYERFSHACEIGPDGKAVNRDMLAVQLRAWDLYRDGIDPSALRGQAPPATPVVYDEILKAEERRDPARFRVESGGQWAEVQDAFLLPWMVDGIFQPCCAMCGRSMPEQVWVEGAGACPVCGTEGSPLQPTRAQWGTLNHRYVGHGDPAESADSFTFCIAHLQEFADPDGSVSLHVMTDELLAWDPADYPDHRLPLRAIEEEIVETAMRYRTLGSISFDQFGSASTVDGIGAELARRGHPARVHKIHHGAANNRGRAEIYYELASLNRIHSFRDALGPGGVSRYELELRFLQRVGDRVEAPSYGPVVHDDMWDAASTALATLVLSELGASWREKLKGLRPEFGMQGGINSASPFSAPPSRLRGTAPSNPGPEISEQRARLLQHRDAALARHNQYGNRTWRNPIGPQGLDWHKRGPAG